MADADIEKLDNLEVAFEVEMAKASSATLFELGKGLGIPDFSEGMRKAEKMAALREYVHKSWGEDASEQISYMQGLHETLASFQKDRREREQRSPPPEMFANHQRLLADQRTREEEERRQFGRSSSSRQAEATDAGSEGREVYDLIRSLADANIAQRRVCKFVGVIGGDSGDSRKVTYSNICGQVEDARASGYKEEEIARALKRACAAGSHLRTYFDAARDMKLKEMLSMLRDFYQERSAAELFAELGQLVQGAQEKSTDFLLRAMEVRQRTTAAAAIEGGLYNVRLIRGTFVRAIKTGLREGAVSAQMAPHLRADVPVDDSVLLREMNAADAEMEEKRTKIKRDGKTKGVTIAQATASVPNFDEALKPILEGMTALQKRMDSLQSRGATHDSSEDHRPSNRRGSGPGRGGGRPRKCKQCQRDDIRNCWHCFNCGAEEHYAIDCTVQKN